MDSWVLVPCQKSRLDLLQRLLTSLDHPSDKVVVVTTEIDPLTDQDLGTHNVLLYGSHEINIGKWWNFGLDFIQFKAKSKHEVLVISSDYVGTEYSVAMLGVFLRKNNLAMVGPDNHLGKETTFRLLDTRSPQARVPGACWMIAGELGIRCDTQFRWWYSDDDIEMQCRKYSAVGVIPNTGLISGLDTPLSEEKAKWATEDRVKFKAKWGIEPW